MKTFTLEKPAIWYLFNYHYCVTSQVKTIHRDDYKWGGGDYK